MVESYRSEIVQNFLYYIPEHVLGIKRCDTTYNVFWDQERLQILIVMEMNKDVHFQLADAELELLRGDRILLARSVRYTLERITDLAREAELRVVDLTETPSGTVAVAALSTKKLF